MVKQILTRTKDELKAKRSVECAMERHVNEVNSVEMIRIAVAAQGNEKLGKGAERKSYGVEM